MGERLANAGGRTGTAAPQAGGCAAGTTVYQSNTIGGMNNSMDRDSKLLDMSGRHPVTRILASPQDDELIANYRDPAFVLGGWKPQVK